MVKKTSKKAPIRCKTNSFSNLLTFLSHLHATKNRSNPTADALQIYTVDAPVAFQADPVTSFEGLNTIGTGQLEITVNSPGRLMLDFGTEHAAWFEIQISGML